MKFRHHASTLVKAASLAGMLAFAAPALAQDGPPPPPMPGTVDAEGRVYGDAQAAPMAMPPMAGHHAQPQYDRAAWERAREDWLTECRRNHGNGNMVGGAVVGGVVGGLLGNVIAKRGDKTLGTVAGAAVGAAAGGALGHGADKRRVRDYCESYLERHMGQGYGQAYPYGYPAYGYAYQPMTVMVPVMMVQAAPAPQRQQRECKETQVIEEWVPVARPARRYIPRRAVPDKRVRIVPDKRVRTN